MGVCNCSMFCCTLLYVPSNLQSSWWGRESWLICLVWVSLSSWCLVIVVWLFLAVPWVRLQFVIVVFPDHTHYFFYKRLTALNKHYMYWCKPYMPMAAVRINIIIQVFLTVVDGTTLPLKHFRERQALQLTKTSYLRFYRFYPFVDIFILRPDLRTC